MSKLDWTRVGLPNPDPADYNPDRNLRYAPFKAETKPKQGKLKKRSRTANSPRKVLVDVLATTPEFHLNSIGKRIVVIEQSGKPDANEFIHRTAIMILQHAEKTGDCSAALDLIQALPDGARRQRLALWFQKYSPISFNAQSGRIRIARPGQKAFKSYAIDLASRHSFR